MYYMGTSLKIWSGLCEFSLAKCLTDLTKFLTGGYSVPEIFFAFRKMWSSTWLEKPHRDLTINLSQAHVATSLMWKHVRPASTAEPQVTLPCLHIRDVNRCPGY